jgi:hypothetical protein
MDFLEANKDAIEQAIFHRVADLLNLDVEVIFYDTTSLHFEISDEDVGDPDGKVQGSAAAGKKSYAAPRKRGHSKNGRSDAPQIVVGMAVTRDRFPVRHWVFPGNTVDVTTVAKVKDDLRGCWRTSSCALCQVQAKNSMGTACLRLALTGPPGGGITSGRGVDGGVKGGHLAGGR